MTHILVVEDEQHLAIGIKFNLESEDYQVTAVGDGQAALTTLRSSVPPIDLVLLDIMIPGMSGYDVCKTIRREGNPVPIVMLTARTLVEDRIQGFDSGTDVYIQKPFDLEELLSVIRNLLHRRGRTDQATNTDPPTSRSPVLKFGTAEVNFDTWEVSVGNNPVRLTNLEMKLLQYLVEHEGIVVSRDELLRNVWGLTRSPATRTIDTFMLNLRKSFEENPSRPKHFLSIRGRGYRFVR